MLPEDIFRQGRIADNIRRFAAMYPQEADMAILLEYGVVSAEEAEYLEAKGLKYMPYHFLPRPGWIFCGHSEHGITRLMSGGLPFGDLPRVCVREVGARLMALYREHLIDHGAPRCFLYPENQRGCIEFNCQCVAIYGSLCYADALRGVCLEGELHILEVGSLWKKYWHIICHGVGNINQMSALAERLLLAGMECDYKDVITLAYR